MENIRAKKEDRIFQKTWMLPLYGYPHQKDWQVYEYHQFRSEDQH